MGENLMSGHGWIDPLPGGLVARCGGPAMCPGCQEELRAKYQVYGNTVITPRGSAVMSIRFSDADLRIDCHTDGCRKHFHGDSANDAWAAWYRHLADDHPDWGTT
jgi:hypothetical protein